MRDFAKLHFPSRFPALTVRATVNTVSQKIDWLRTAFYHHLPLVSVISPGFICTTNGVFYTHSLSLVHDFEHFTQDAPIT